MPNEIIETFISSQQRQLLWALLQHDTANSVFNIINDQSINPHEKTARVVNQLDFVFDTRNVVGLVPQQGGKARFTELMRAYLSAMLDQVHEERLSPELRATWPSDRQDLQMKLGDMKAGFLLPYIRRMLGSS